MQPEEHPAPDHRGWLDRLQQDSWQLELLVSGFAIFLLLAGWAPYRGLMARAEVLTAESSAYFMLLLTLGLLSVAYGGLIAALILHVVLRGMWIAAVGLRSVSGGLDYEALRYQTRYRRFLEGRIGTFDAYIQRLERWCSVVFSIAFLIIFCFVSLTSYFLFVMVLQWFGIAVFGGDWSANGVFGNAGFIDLPMIVVGVIYLVDFFTLGFFKRNRFTATVYYPIYRFVGWITLANLYRPLYHNLIDDRFGRKLARLLPVIVLGLLLVVSIRIVTNAHFPYYAGDGRVWIDSYNYDDQLNEPYGQSWRVTLASKYATNNYVEAFAPYRARSVNPVLARLHPDLPVARYTGLRFGEPLQVGESYNRDVSVYPELLTAFTGLFRCYVDDSLRTDVQPRFHQHPTRGQAGLLYVIPVHDLPTGEHTLRMEQRRLRGDSLYWRPHPNVYFYR